MSATPTSTAPLLEVRDLEKSFPGVRALSGVSFDVSAGEVHALLGENGAGKSTLIKIVSGVYQPDAGEILIDGRAARFATPEEAQARRGRDHLSGAAALSRAHRRREHLPRPRAARRRRPDRLARHAGEGRGAARLARDRRPRRRPDRRRAVGRQPAAGRDPARAVARRAHPDHGRADRRADRERRRRACSTSSGSSKARGVGIVYISHRLDEIFEIADRVTVLRDGAYVGIAGDRARPTAAELVQMMVGRRIENLFPKTAVPIGAPVLEARDLVRRPMTRSVSLTVRAGEIVGLAGLVGSGRSELAQTIFGITPAESGRDPAQRRGGRRSIRPRARARAGIAYVPEDRGVQGLVRPMSVLHNFSLAALGAPVARSASSTAPPSGAWPRTGVKRFSVKTSSRRRDRRPPLRRQPAEDRAGQVARQQSEAAHPRRADARHRRRRQGRDSPPDVRARRPTGVAILMISSELPEVLGMSDRVLVMREGRLVAEFDRAHATSESGRRGDDGRATPTMERAA